MSEPIYVDFGNWDGGSRPTLEVDAPPYTDDPDDQYLMWLAVTSRFVTADGEKVTQRVMVGLRERDAVSIYAALGTIVNMEEATDGDTHDGGDTGPGTGPQAQPPSDPGPPWDVQGPQDAPEAHQGAPAGPAGPDGPPFPGARVRTRTGRSRR